LIGGNSFVLKVNWFLLEFELPALLLLLLFPRGEASGAIKKPFELIDALQQQSVSASVKHARFTKHQNHL
jgi:hypothetical protein